MLEGLFGMLAFLAACLALASGLVWAAASLAARRWRQAARAGLALLAIVGVYAVLLLGFSLASRQQSITLGTERCFDEMCFSLQGVETAPTLGSQQSQLGSFYILTIQLRSTARRTAQKPSMPDMFILAAGGKRFTHILSAEPSDAGQPLSAAQVWDQKVQPGAAVVRRVAFDLPASVVDPGLVIGEGIGPLSLVIIGDEGSFLHARTVFALQP